MVVETAAATGVASGCASSVRFTPPITPATRLYNQEDSATTSEPSTAYIMVITIQATTAMNPVALTTYPISSGMPSDIPNMPTKLAMSVISTA